MRSAHIASVWEKHKSATGIRLQKMIDKITAIKDYHQPPWLKGNAFRITEIYQSLTLEETYVPFLVL